MHLERWLSVVNDRHQLFDLEENQERDSVDTDQIEVDALEHFGVRVNREGFPRACGL
jgi:hypothetical protein